MKSGSEEAPRLILLWKKFSLYHINATFNLSCVKTVVTWLSAYACYHDTAYMNTQMHALCKASLVRRYSVHLVEPWIKLQSQCQTTTWVATKEPSWQLSPENPIVETELNFAFATGRAGVFLQLASFAFPQMWFICQISKLNCFDTRHNLNGADTSMWRFFWKYHCFQWSTQYSDKNQNQIKMRLLKVNTK